MIPAFGSGWLALLYKELLRFWKVSFQTILAPVLTALLYLLIFSHVLESRVSVFEGRVAYTAFLIPGLVMMSVLQNAFANSSSSLIQSKITGNLIFVLVTPLSPLDLFAAYVLGAMVRGIVVGLGVFLVTGWFAPLSLAHPPWALAFALLGSAILGTLGLLAGIWADKFDQLAAFQNFLIMPLTFLSGVFYSLAAAVLAGAVAFQSVLLYDRRLPLRFLRAFRRRSGGEPRRRGGFLPEPHGVDAVRAPARIQTPALTMPRVRQIRSFFQPETAARRAPAPVAMAACRRKST
jgi:ABC-2 type transport system permease protein